MLGAPLPSAYLWADDEETHAHRYLAKQFACHALGAGIGVRKACRGEMFGALSGE